MAKNSFNGEILHSNAVRLRVTGSGSLNLTLKSLDEILENELIPITMEATTYKEPTQLANLESQRIMLEFGTTEINEYFTISKIIIFVKLVQTEYPR